jgi:hypothetical protein
MLALSAARHRQAAAPWWYGESDLVLDRGWPTAVLWTIVAAAVVAFVAWVLLERRARVATCGLSQAAPSGGAAPGKAAGVAAAAAAAATITATYAPSSPLVPLLRRSSSAGSSSGGRARVRWADMAAAEADRALVAENERLKLRLKTVTSAAIAEEDEGRALLAGARAEAAQAQAAAQESREEATALRASLSVAEERLAQYGQLERAASASAAAHAQLLAQHERLLQDAAAAKVEAASRDRGCAAAEQALAASAAARDAARRAIFEALAAGDAAVALAAAECGLELAAGSLGPALLEAARDRPARAAASAALAAAASLGGDAAAGRRAALERWQGAVGALPGDAEAAARCLLYACARDATHALHALEAAIALRKQHDEQEPKPARGAEAAAAAAETLRCAVAAGESLLGGPVQELTDALADARSALDCFTAISELQAELGACPRPGVLAAALARVDRLPPKLLERLPERYVDLLRAARVAHLQRDARDALECAVANGDMAGIVANASDLLWDWSGGTGASSDADPKAGAEAGTEAAPEDEREGEQVVQSKSPSSDSLLARALGVLHAAHVANHLRAALMSCASTGAAETLRAAVELAHQPRDSVASAAVATACGPELALAEQLLATQRAVEALAAALGSRQTEHLADGLLLAKLSADRVHKPECEHEREREPEQEQEEVHQQQELRQDEGLQSAAREWPPHMSIGTAQLLSLRARRKELTGRAGALLLELRVDTSLWQSLSEDDPVALRAAVDEAVRLRLTHLPAFHDARAALAKHVVVGLLLAAEERLQAARAETAREPPGRPGAAVLPAAATAHAHAPASPTARVTYERVIHALGALGGGLELAQLNGLDEQHPAVRRAKEAHHEALAMQLEAAGVTGQHEQQHLLAMGLEFAGDLALLTEADLRVAGVPRITCRKAIDRLARAGAAAEARAALVRAEYQASLDSLRDNGPLDVPLRKMPLAPALP